MIVPFEARHFRMMNLQDAQRHIGYFITEDYAKELEQAHSFTLLDGETVLASGGLIPLWSGRAQVWTMIAGEAKGAKFIKVHKAVKRFLDSCYIRRVEATVDCGFKQGHEWMRLLGFECEAPRMKGYRPDGADCALYARVLPWV